MKFRCIFILMTVALLIIAAALFALTESDGWIFYTAEGALAALFIMILITYRSTVKPMNAITLGMDLLQQQDFSSRLVKVHQKDADKIITIFNTMMDTMKAQRLLVRERNEFLDLLINQSPVGVLIFDQMNRIESANPAAADMFGQPSADSLVGKNLREIPSALARAAAGVKDAEVIRQTDGGICRCSTNTFMDNGWPHPFMLIESLTDEVRRAEQRAYGKLIRMIAHEVNNTMGGVSSTLSTVSDAVATDDADLSAALSACGDRCRMLTNFISRIASVAKVPEPQLTETKPDAIVRSCRIFLETLCTPRHIKLTTELDAETGTINADPELIQQVLVNIVKNAAESIGSDGCITISATGRELTVTDNGPGLSAEAESNLFSPFYTSKPQGHGLGLTLVSEILKKHGCHFSLSTDDDGMTRFRIKFAPATDKIYRRQS